MTNYSGITLRIRRNELSKGLTALRRSAGILKSQQSTYAEHHQHVINAYVRVIEVLDEFIAESYSVGDRE